MSALTKAINEGRLAVTVEVTPPRGPDPRRMKELASVLKGRVDAAVAEENFDGAHMSSLVAGVHLRSEGLECIATVLTRDTNRIGLQSWALGAISLGISDVLVLSGHHQALTAEKEARGVYDVDSVQAIGIFRAMRDEGVLACGEKMEGPACFSIGGAANPFGGPIHLRAVRTMKKAMAGADFIITQPVFDVARFQEWLGLLRERGLPDKVCLVAGILWLRSAEEARKLNETYRGMNIPEKVIDRLSGAADGEREGLLIAGEVVEQVRSLEAVRGLHFWAREREESLPELLDSCGVSIS